MFYGYNSGIRHIIKQINTVGKIVVSSISEKQLDINEELYLVDKNREKYNHTLISIIENNISAKYSADGLYLYELYKKKGYVVYKTCWGCGIDYTETKTPGISQKSYRYCKECRVLTYAQRKNKNLVSQKLKHA